MRAYLTRRYSLAASHRLFRTDKGDEENLAIFGKCANPYGHGHNYIVEVTLGGPVDPLTGMVLNLRDLDPLITREILDRYDHTNLNLLPEFAAVVPTTEHFALAIHARLAASSLAPLLLEVRVEETPNNSFVTPGSLEHGQLQRHKDQAQ